MADKDLTVHLKADDKITPAAKKAADALKKLEETDVEVEVDADVSRVLGAFDQVAAEAKATAEAAEALGRALGPELAAKADPAGLVGDLRDMGLTLDQVKGNADELGAKLRELSDADVGGKMGTNLGTARGKMDELRGSADQSRSVLANMVGNSAQDLGALGGVAGSAGVAIGQLAEYATEGGISLGNLAKVAGPMLGLAAATELLSTVLGGIKAEKVFEAKLVTQFTNALKEGRTVAEDIRQTVAETGELLFETGAGGGGGLFGLGSKAADLIPIFDELGFTTEEWLGFLDDPRGQADKFIAQAEAMAAGNVDQQKTLLDAAAGLMSYGDAAKEAADRDKIRAEVDRLVVTDEEKKAAATKAATELTEKAAARSEEHARRLEEEATAQDDLRAATEAYTDSLKAQVDAMVSAADASIAVSEAQEGFVDAVVESAAVQADAARTTVEKAEAVDAERDAMIDAAKAQVQLADENAKASGKTLTATEKVDAYNSSLLSNARYATPAAQRAAYEYILQVNDIPEEKATEILALVDQGRLDEADAKLNDASRARTVAVTADAHTEDAESEIANLIRTRNMTINAQIVARGGAGYAPPGTPAGGPFMAPMVAATATPTATPTAVAPMAVPPIIINVPAPAPTTVDLRGSVSGNRFDLDRTLTKALRRHQRLNGLRE